MDQVSDLGGTWARLGLALDALERQAEAIAALLERAIACQQQAGEREPKNERSRELLASHRAYLQRVGDKD